MMNVYSYIAISFFFAVLQMQGYRLQVCGFCDIFMTDQQIQEKLIF